MIAQHALTAAEPRWRGFERLAFMGGSRMLAAALGFLGATLVAGLLEPGDLGLWAMALAVQGYALHLSEFGLRSVVTAEAPALEGRFTALLRRYLKLRLGLCLLVVILIAAGALLVIPHHAPLLVTVACSILAIALMVDWVPLVRGRHRTASGLLLVRPLLFCIGLFLIPTAASPQIVAVVFLFAWIGAAAMSWLFVGRLRSQPVSSAPSLPNDRGFLRLGWPLLLVTLTNQALMSADLLLVGLIVGTAAAGYFYLASAIAVAGLVFANASGQLALARLGRWRDQPDRWFHVLKREALTSLLVGCAAAIGLGLVLPPLVLAWFGEAYATAAGLLPWFAPWLVLQHVSAVLQSGLATTRLRRVLLEANTTALAVTGLGLTLLFLIGIQAFSIGTVLAALALLRALSEAVKTVILWEGALRYAEMRPKGRSVSRTRSTEDEQQGEHDQKANDSPIFHDHDETLRCWEKSCRGRSCRLIVAANFGASRGLFLVSAPALFLQGRVPARHFH